MSNLRRLSGLLSAVLLLTMPVNADVAKAKHNQQMHDKEIVQGKSHQPCSNSSSSSSSESSSCPSSSSSSESSSCSKPDKKCVCNPFGCRGATGKKGATGAPGATGAAGGVLAAADFYALMPGDNADTVAAGTEVDFPQDGPVVGTGITRDNAFQFNLADIGTYQILFQVSVTEAGQLVVALNGVEQPYTVVGRATGTSQIVGLCLVQTTTVDTKISIRNPTGNTPALTITPSAGGTHSVSAHLVITQIS